jgi:hypothetical protein
MQRQIHDKDRGKVLWEMRLFENIRFTDTVEQHDTLTIAPAFVQDPGTFYNTGLEFFGSNFLKLPIETVHENDEFTTHCPAYFKPKQLFPLAYFVMFILERSLWFQYEAHCV